MKTKILTALTALTLMLFSPAGFGADNSTAAEDLKDLVSRINAKLEAKHSSEGELASEIKEFDALLVKHKGEDAEELSQILSMKGGLYLQVLNAPDKAEQVFKQIKQDYPETKTGKRVDEILAMLAQQVESKKIQDSLVVGNAFPQFSETDSGGKPLSLASYKGKVVLLDFWATWCGPCRIELPNVIAIYKKHHADGFEIVGISLDDDKAGLEKFTREKEMTWPQFFDGLKWKNKLALKYGVNSIPATYLLDGDGKIIAKDLRGEELESAVAAALAKK